MAPQEKKWDDAAERDLCVAIIQGNQEGTKVRYNWPRVEEIMTSLGHSFTRDAMSQHFSKTIMKEFHARHPKDDTTETPPASATKPKTPRKTATPSKKRGKKGAKAQAPEVDDQTDDDLELDATPSKKVKKEDKSATLKKEEADTQSAAANDDNDKKFQSWVAEGSDTKP
ncbi:uncharacterized protein TRIVIDRAFT_219926 [Trichoderma virens Gv29-8]|uniref:Myb-like domain-containing protein n=1 Tax=Hypocrea virens (strain Gv29-8 / FGSC 10586) TaxID=413071 RepID=G9MMA2_HYPVG|nr:uncharacterized protein TRIVIDRAFT_219926 [Trichoderma virens Gv29-8]EHK24471.1 hypothetical protein TRIVIDRAFT_219926 [Trichoderma virens Gv29-8]UKZ54743.1 hypothetical protein TrVGV298_008555 [Trichoderma virens]UKZ80523.1 hypothetical protein TrVFT333_008284 [Trichoderma virens FT-333]